MLTKGSAALVVKRLEHIGYFNGREAQIKIERINRETCVGERPTELHALKETLCGIWCEKVHDIADRLVTLDGI